jgi:hypothetical protein
MEFKMKEIEQLRPLSLPNLPIIRISHELNNYDNLPTFQRKVDEVTELINRVGVPEEYIKAQEQSVANSERRLLMRISHTVELIKKYDLGIKQAVLLRADPELIEGWQMMKARYVTDLIELMAEMDVDLELKTAA